MRSLMQFQLVAPLAVGVLASCGLDSDQPAQVAMDRGEQGAAPTTGSVCSTGPIRCYAHALAAEGHVTAHAAPNGYGPADLQAAYNVPTPIAGAPVIAVVDAYGHPG